MPKLFDWHIESGRNLGRMDGIVEIVDGEGNLICPMITNDDAEEMISAITFLDRLAQMAGDGGFGGEQFTAEEKHALGQANDLLYDTPTPLRIPRILPAPRGGD